MSRTALTALPALYVGREGDLNDIVQFETLDSLRAEKTEIEFDLYNLTAEPVQSFGHIVETLRTRLMIVNRNLSIQ
jgi:hypothetical protein